MPKGCVPLLGHLLRLDGIMKKYKSNEHPGTIMLREDFGLNQPKIIFLYMSYEPLIFFRDPKLIEQLYVQYNKYFDKFFVIRDLLHPLMGDSILLQESNENWMQKRKSLAVAFYKEKLLKMIDIVKDCMGKKVQEWREKFVKPKKQMDLIAEISKTFVMVLLSCAFGEDLSDKVIDYYVNGVRTQKTVCFVLREVFHKCVMK